MTQWRLLALYISIGCGFVFVSAAITSDGWDLRPTGGDVSSLLQERTRDAQNRQAKVAGLEGQIESLSENTTNVTLAKQNRRIEKYRDAAGMTAMEGPGVRVELDDAPRSVEVPGLDPNLLVIHQQDIQAVVNALWQGGAEAVTLQGQRITSTTGIKCVGNTVILNGVPYSPPYVVEAIGSQYGMSNALENSPEVSILRDYADRYGLGYATSQHRTIKAAAAEGATAMTHASVID